MSPRQTLAHILCLNTVLLAAACAAGHHSDAARAEPPHIADDALITGDGAALPVRRWLPDGPPRGVVLGVHGFNDYGNAFAIPAVRWTAAGMAVFSYDQRGFGAADAPGRWAGGTVMVDDLADMTAALAAAHPELPLTVVGVSMGGAVAVAALAAQRLPDAAGVVLVAPAVWARETMPLPYRATLWLAARTLPWLRLGGRGLGITPSDNREMLRALGRDPLIIRKSRVDVLEGLTDLMDQAYAAAPAAAAAGASVLLLYGANDEIIPRAPTEDTVCRMAPETRMGVYPQGFHMLLRDLQASVVHDDVLAWIDDRQAPLPSGAEDEARSFFPCLSVLSPDA